MHGFDSFEFIEIIPFLCSYTCMTTMDGDSMTFMEFHEVPCNSNNITQVARSIRIP